LDVVYSLCYFFAIPLLFQPDLQVFSVLLVIPILPLIGFSLQENALSQDMVMSAGGMRLSLTAKSVLSGLGAVTILCLLLGNWILALVGCIGLLFIAGMLLPIWRNVGSAPLAVEQAEVRLVAGTTGEVVARLTSRARSALHVSISSSYPWIHPAVKKFVNLTKDEELRLKLAPLLSGPSEPELRLTSVDSHGLVQVGQQIKPVRLYVIPRARYAEWLARKYLEETASPTGATYSAFSPIPTGSMPRGNVEYCDSRYYQPGDRLKDIDWKHTAKLQRLVVKEYADESRQMAVIVVNLAAADAEQADTLVYYLITSALTLATGTISTAVAAYDEVQVRAATAPLAPRELVQKALQLGQEVVLVMPLERYIQPPDIRQLRISLGQLKDTNLEAGRKLREILDFERKAIEEGAKEHPMREALNRVLAHTLPPVTVTVISSWDHDSEALSVVLEELARKGCGAALININEKK